MFQQGMSVLGDPSKRIPYGALVWGLVGAATCAAMIPLEPNLLEEGMILEIAQRLVHGDHLYQDVVAFTGPLPFEALAFLFRIFQEEILVARTAVALLHGAATASVFSIARQARRDELSHLAAAITAFSAILLFPLFSIYFYTTLAVSLGVIASWAALRGLKGGRAAIVAGIVTALCALCKQTIGAVLAAGLLISIIACAPPRVRFRSALRFILGGIATAAVTLGAFAVTGGLDSLVYSMVELPLSFQSTYNSPFMNFWPPGTFSQEVRGSQAFYLPYFYTLVHGGWGLTPGPGITLLTQTLYALPFLAMVLSLLRRWRTRLPAATWIHLAYLVAMISNIFPRSDWGHLASVLPSAAVQVILIVPLPHERNRVRKGIAAGLVTLLALVSLLVGAWLYRLSEPPSFGPRVPLRVVSEGHRADVIPHVIRYLRQHTQPGDAIFVARAEPLIYFATDTRNPTPYSGVIPGMPGEQQRVIVDALETTRYVVMSDIDQPVFTYYRDELPRVQEALERYYRIPDDFLRPGPNWMIVLERAVDRGATRVDLIDIAEEGTRWIRRMDGSLAPGRVFHETIGTIQNHRFLPFLLGIRGGGIDFDITIPDNAVFRSGVGYPLIGTGAKNVYRLPEESRMVLSIKTDGHFRKIGEIRLPANDGSIDRWLPFEVDLSEYAGTRATLRLQLIPSRPVRPGELGWWGSPRITIRPSPSSARMDRRPDTPASAGSDHR
ncbi:MAG TPA: hypothetical protein ENI85_18505 [Deltaproteobacteria bacterium]|nr:hypothetical protein [Deltaproteobacteria bacterium]